MVPEPAFPTGTQRCSSQEHGNVDKREDKEQRGHLGQWPQGNHANEPPRNEGSDTQRAGNHSHELRRSGASAGDGSSDEADSRTEDEGAGVCPGDEVERVGAAGERSHGRVRKVRGPEQAEKGQDRSGRQMDAQGPPVVRSMPSHRDAPSRQRDHRLQLASESRNFASLTWLCVVAAPSAKPKDDPAPEDTFAPASSDCSS